VGSRKRDPDGHPSHKAKKVQAFADSPHGQLRLFFLPPYSPDLNPDELAWNQVKRHKVGRTPVIGPDGLKHRAISALRSLQKFPAKVRALFQAPSLQYAATACVLQSTHSLVTAEPVFGGRGRWR